MNLYTKNIGKTFSGVNVLRKVNFDLKPGEVHALVGENGAGKSTFVKVISGVYTPTDGDIFLDGKKIQINTPIAAQKNGVSLIHQEPQSFSHLSVAENIFMGHMDGSNFSRVKWKDINKSSEKILSSIGLEIDPKNIMEGLSIADQQMIEIAGALSKNSKILIMDEPTSPLTPNEVGKLFDIVKQLKDQGMAIIFISHRLEEIRAIADRVTIFRDGDLITTKKINEVSNEEIIKYMIGRSIEDIEVKENEYLKNNETILSVNNISQLGNFKNDDLIGQRLIRRQTFQKYLHGESGDASPPIELRTQEYIIDRIGQETSVSVTFEMAAPFDLEGIKVPRRIVVGKYCSWKYQGHDTGKGGGCTWKADGSYKFRDSSDNTFSHNGYFNFDDSPLVVSTTAFSTYASNAAYTTNSYVTHSGKKWLCTIAGTGNTPSETSAYWKQVFTWSDYSSSTSYSIDDLVRSSNTIWKSTHNSNQDNTPAHGTGHWIREEICGKTLQSCKARYGIIPAVNTSANQPPSGRTSKAARLPFGSFPGTLKY